MHLLVTVQERLKELKEIYEGMHSDREEILSNLNEKVIAKRETAYASCKKELFEELKLKPKQDQTFEDARILSILNKDDQHSTRKEEEKLEHTKYKNKDRAEKKEIFNLVMERLPEEYVFAYRQEGIYAGTPIYKKRNEWVVFLMIGIALFDLSMSLLYCSFPSVVLACGIMFFVADIQTGILHITLDNRVSFQYPVLSQPCMEFMWHHIMPHDLADRYCVDIWGDLNVIMTIATAILTGFKVHLKDPLYYALSSFQILFIYFAIYCHRLSHSRGKYNDFLTKVLHEHHKIHHIAPHNDNFCLIGVGDFIIAPMAKHIPALVGPQISYFFFLILMLGLITVHPTLVQFIHFLENAAILPFVN